MNVHLVNEHHGERWNLEITFQTTKPGERRMQGKKELIDTTCRIFLNGDELNSDKVSVLATAVARQSPLDAYNKIVGKKVALTKALKQIRWLKDLVRGYSIFDRERLARKKMRATIWATFFQTFGRWS